MTQKNKIQEYLPLYIVIYLYINIYHLHTYFTIYLKLTHTKKLFVNILAIPLSNLRYGVAISSLENYL
jgi:hypothetical protein